MFIAGATGYLGRFMVKEALRRGYKVRALTRDKARLPAELAEIQGRASPREQGWVLNFVRVALVVNVGQVYKQLVPKVVLRFNIRSMY